MFCDILAPFILFINDTSDTEAACALLKELKFRLSGLPLVEQIEDRRKESGTYQVLLCHPPFGKTKGGERLEHRFVSYCLQILSDGGKCVCILPNGWLSRTSATEDTEMRKVLIENYLLKSVILLPKHLFQSYTSANMCLVTFEQQTSMTTERVQLMDLRQVSPERELCEMIKEAHHQSNAKDQREGDVGYHCRQVTVNELRENHYILIPEQYLERNNMRDQAGTEAGQRLRILEKRLRMETGREQLSLFNDRERVPSNTRKLYREYTELIYQELDRTFIGRFGSSSVLELQWPRSQGRELFSLQSGEALPKDTPEGPYPLFGGNGITGYVASANLQEPLPTLVINRVGVHCGRVYRVTQPCWVSQNAMFLSAMYQSFVPEFLYFLFRSADFNRYKRGSAQQYITQEIVLNHEFVVPSISAQQEFGDLVQRELERLEEMDNALGGLRPEVP